MVDVPDALTVTAAVESRLTWDYSLGTTRILRLYEQAKGAQWDAGTAIDWHPVEFGAPLSDDSAFGLSGFAASPLAARGRAAWDAFRWEFQSFLVSQFLHGEQGALVAAARLAETLPGLDAKCYAASQVGDEARHVEAFSRYLRENVPEPYPISAGLASLLDCSLRDSRWDVTTLGMQIVVEGLAMSAFRLANRTFHDDLIRQITHLVARDEARHVSFGILALDGLYGKMTAAEVADREDFVLEAARAMHRRFLLEEIWDRLEVDRREGMAFAGTNDVMVAYRQAVFGRVVVALSRLGLLSGRVRRGLDQLGLLDLAGRAPSTRSRWRSGGGRA